MSGSVMMMWYSWSRATRAYGSISHMRVFVLSMIIGLTPDSAATTTSNNKQIPVSLALVYVVMIGV